MQEGISLGISICAIIISVASPVFEFFWNKRMNERNLTAEYFKELFGDMIYIDLPKAREFLHFNGKEISGTEELEKVMRSLRQKLIYFKKNNEGFYNQMLKVIQEFENHLVTKSGKADNGAFIEFHNKVDEYVEKIYLYINDMYMGKKFKKKKKKE